MLLMLILKSSQSDLKSCPSKQWKTEMHLSKLREEKELVYL